MTAIAYTGKSTTWHNAEKRSFFLRYSSKSQAFPNMWSVLIRSFHVARGFQEWVKIGKYLGMCMCICIVRDDSELLYLPEILQDLRFSADAPIDRGSAVYLPR